MIPSNEKLPSIPVSTVPRGLTDTIRSGGEFERRVGNIRLLPWPETEARDPGTRNSDASSGDFVSSAYRVPRREFDTRDGAFRCDGSIARTHPPHGSFDITSPPVFVDREPIDLTKIGSIFDSTRLGPNRPLTKNERHQISIETMTHGIVRTGGKHVAN